MRISPLLVILAISLPVAWSRSAQEWRTRSIYQILTDRFARPNGDTSSCSDLGHYCGGGYRGVTAHLDYIAGMGFNAIWISPIIENYDGNYHGYAGRNIYALNPNFGTEQEFHDFIAECHKRDIWVMVDVVANHMGNLDEDFSKNTPFNKAEHFHSFCEISGDDFARKNMANIQNCRLARLADLRQENSWVKDTLVSWIRDLVVKHNIDGLRIDTVP